ncbi:MAG TPA: exonuclease SbcCD subunit D [Blastocatellia bacterium]|nr:exonuclease SbcCD subunit D [Blastocatellia bacterium]
MARFLHIADIHLGIKRYNLPDRTGDFFRAWRDVIERYALARRVDFVLIAGDLFDRRNVDPQAANHAMFMLRQLADARIPVVVIEGNHDQHEATSRFSWLRSFSQWRFMKLLEPRWTEEGLRLDAWDEEEASGSYIDIADARIFGSNWYGSTVGNTLPVLAEGVRAHRREGAANIMLLHSDVEGQLNRPIQNALSISKLVELRGAVDYLALGHTHKRFQIEDWAFNPGSLEACSVDEAVTERGAYIVETTGPKIISMEFIAAGEGYFQRPFRRIEHEVSGKEEPDAIRAEIFETLHRECAIANTIEEEQRPIIELTLRGQLGFKNSLLRLDKLKEQAIEELRPLGLIINNKTIPKQLAVAVDLARDTPRNERELRVIEDLIKPDPRFGARASEIAAIVVEAKRLALEGESAEKILKMIEDRLFQPASEQSGELPLEAVYAEGAD